METLGFASYVQSGLVVLRDHYFIPAVYLNPEQYYPHQCHLIFHFYHLHYNSLCVDGQSLKNSYEPLVSSRQKNETLQLSFPF